MKINIEQLLSGPRSSLRQRIADYFRREIAKGAIASGETLPSGQALAAELGTSAVNVHKALSQLAAEGLISRIPGVGSVVNATRRMLRQAAIVIFSPGLSGPSGFIQQLAVRLERELRRSGCGSIILLERKDRPDWTRLEDLVARREVQGVIPLTINREIFQKIRSLPVPSAFFSGNFCRARIYYSTTELARCGVEALARQGCRRIGVISSLSDPSPGRCDFNGRCLLRFYDELFRHAARLGLEIRHEWVEKLPGECDAPPEWRTAEWYSLQAYQAFDRIWNRAVRPDGLFVYTDDLVSGTLLSILHRRAAVPDELKLALFRNRELPQLCPLPCMMVENSIDVMAAALCSLLLRQFNGERVSPIRIPLEIVNQTGRE